MTRQNNPYIPLVMSDSSTRTDHDRTPDSIHGLCIGSTVENQSNNHCPVLSTTFQEPCSNLHSTMCLEGGYTFHGYFPLDPTAFVETKGGCGTTHPRDWHLPLLHSTSPALCMEGGYGLPLCMHLFLDGPRYVRSGPHTTGARSFCSALNWPAKMKKHKLFIGQLPYWITGYHLYHMLQYFTGGWHGEVSIKIHLSTDIKKGYFAHVEFTEEQDKYNVLELNECVVFDDWYAYFADTLERRWQMYDYMTTERKHRRGEQDLPMKRMSVVLAKDDWEYLAAATE